MRISIVCPIFHNAPSLLSAARSLLDADDIRLLAQLRGLAAAERFGGRL